MTFRLSDYERIVDIKFREAKEVGAKDSFDEFEHKTPRGRITQDEHSLKDPTRRI